MKISGTTRFAGVIGWPVTHSLSPAIHNHWCRQYGIDAVYLPLPVDPADLTGTLPALAKSGCLGVNLTLPHKQLVLPVLDVIDAQARRIGAVNTVLFQHGQLLGFNTDIYGFWKSIEVSQPDIRRDNAFVVGAGGAARAVVAALDLAGYKRIYVMNRTPDRVESLRSITDKVVPVSWFLAPDEFVDCDLVVNTTSLGMAGQPELQLALGKLPPHAVVNDIVYSPLDTPLLQSASNLRLQVVDGLGMLLYQAQKAFEIWFGIVPGVTPELRLKVLEERI